MTYFGAKKQPHLLAIVVSVLIFVAVLGLFVGGVSSLDRRIKAEQQQSLNSALQKSIVQCYVQEGRYPQSLNYLETYYSLDYDKELFWIDYQPIGENIMPDFTVLMRKEAS